MAASNTNDSDPCATLSTLLPGKVSYPPDAEYETSLTSYFFKQERELTPQCIVQPTSALDVSTIIKTLADTGIKAAIRGGGHTPFAGAANVDKGVTIDLRSLNTVTLRQADATTGLPIGELNAVDAGEDGVSGSSSNGLSTGDNPPVVSVGGGAIWSQVYEKLTPHLLTAIGGRGASLGVGGLLTGGGISFFSPERGFACDNVVNMEIVLADGSTVNTNANERADLFRALKGGSNNFGIVTRFDLKTYPQGKFWGGLIAYPSSTIPEQLTAFENFMKNSKADAHAHLFTAIGYVSAYASTVVSNGLYYNDAVENPDVFRPFTSIEPQIYSTLRVADNVNFTQEIETNQDKGARALYVNTVFRPTTSMIQTVYQLWSDSLKSVSNVEGITYFLVQQPLAATLPGNSLGLEASSDNPLVLCLLQPAWSNARDDELIRQVVRKLIEDIETASKAAGDFVEYKYLNYAADFQDPIASYGSKNQENLKAVSKKYDPKGFFQTNIQGGFKLFRKKQ